MKKAIIISASLAVVLTGVVAFAYTQNDTQSNESTQSSEEISSKDEDTASIDTSPSMDIKEAESDETATEQPPQATPGAASTPKAKTATVDGSYVDYSSSAFTSAKGTRVLFFHAPWCSQCRSVESGMAQKNIPDGFTILKTDYDSRQDLRQKYGVTLQTTFVAVDANGDLVKKYVAYESPTFDAVKQDFLNTL